MALISTRITIRIDIGAGAPPELIVRRPTAAEHQAFLKDRFREKRNKVQQRVYEARSEFVDSILLDCRNVQVEDGEGKPVELNQRTELTPELRSIHGLGEKADWKSFIPVNWKATAAMYFEDREQDLEEPEGNS